MIVANLRPIAALKLPAVEPGGVDMARPHYIDVDPASLLIDERYQRNLSVTRSLKLISTIVANWDWRAFKPPVVVEVDGGLHVLDGQHTAIAAATHPEIATIPVQVVEAGDEESRASAFVKHNRDRIAATPQQLHHALVAAGDEDALTMEQVCARAGARLLHHPPAYGRFRENDIIALATLRGIIDRRFAIGARKVLGICVEAKLAPISTATMRAVEYLLFDKKHAGTFEAGDIATTLRLLGGDADRQGKICGMEHRIPTWRGLAMVLIQKTRRARRGSSAAD